MRKFVYKHTLGYAILFVFAFTFGQQKYSPKASSAQLTLEGKTLNGYTTTFDFAREDVRRGWWKYARTFGSPLNMKTYYKVTVPSERTDGNVNLEIFTQTVRGEGGTEFFTGLEGDTYQEQALVMLLDFKKKFYITELISLIEKKQEKADDLCDEYLDQVLDSKKKELLNEIAEIELEIEGLRGDIKAIENIKN